MSNVYDITSQDLTDEGFVIADRIVLWLEGHAGMHSPSQVARGAKCDTHEAATVLRWLDEKVMVKAGGNGAWRKYGTRR